MQFTHLSVQSDYSLLYSCAKIPGLVQKTKELGMTSIALTDY
ncbi:PHP domain-containing protein [uncultured Treponema sp.]|nr:PHP domain-containing protein [uncultured Treponema sp.]